MGVETNSEGAAVGVETILPISRDAEVAKGAVVDPLENSKDIRDPQGNAGESGV